MHTRVCVLTLIVSLLMGSWGLAQLTAPRAPQQTRITELIRKLGSSSYTQREMARKELQALGTAALEALRGASKTADVETRRRLDALIHRAEEQLLTRQVLAAKEIHLKLTDATVDQGLAELSKLSGYTMRIQGDRTPFADKKITLDTGKTSFWQAFDQFCDQAGLIEKIDLNAATPTVPHQNWAVRGRGGRIRYESMAQPAVPGPIILSARGNEKVLASYAGAVKTQLRLSRAAGKKELQLSFIVSAEPRLLNASVQGSPMIEQVLDQQRHQLTTLLEEVSKDSPVLANPLGRHRLTFVRLQEGEEAAKKLKELAGKLTLQVDLNNELLAKMSKIMDASGHSVAGVNGGSMKVHNVRKVGENIEVEVTLENIVTNAGGNVLINGGNVIIKGNVIVQNIMVGPGGVRVNGMNSSSQLPELLDAKGQKFRVLQIAADSTSIINNSMSRTTRIHYHPNPGQGDPSDLALFGTRTHTIAVPFHFADVPLP